MGEPYKTLERNGMDGQKKREAGKGTKTNAPILYIKTGREKEKDGGRKKEFFHSRCFAPIFFIVEEFSPYITP